MKELVAAVLSIGGDLTGLKTDTRLTGLPFTIIINVMCFSFYKT